MHWSGWIVVGIALLLGGWLAFDGGRALVLGDYVTPSSGAYAGQLGPWASVVSAVGIEPRSTAMKLIHVVLGGAWLLAMVGFAAGASWARSGLLACAGASLWYLPFGTLLSLVEIGLLFLPALRSPGVGISS